MIKASCGNPSATLNFNRKTHSQFISNRNTKRVFRLTGLLRKIFR